jgi:hypothetical protein
LWSEPVWNRIGGLESSFPIKHFNERIIAHRACYEARLLHLSWLFYANKTNNTLKMYNFTLYTSMFFSGSSVSWPRQHNGRYFYEAYYCLTEFATFMSRLRCSQFTIVHHICCMRFLTAVTCGRLAISQPSPKYFVKHVCYWSSL